MCLNSGLFLRKICSEMLILFLFWTFPFCFIDAKMYQQWNPGFCGHWNNYTFETNWKMEIKSSKKQLLIKITCLTTPFPLHTTLRYLVRSQRIFRQAHLFGRLHPRVHLPSFSNSPILFRLASKARHFLGSIRHRICRCCLFVYKSC